MTLTLGLLILLAVPWSEAEPDRPLSRLTVMALAPLDGRAVVKLPDGTMRMVQQGERIPETVATVIQVLPDRLVVSHTTSASGEDIAWIYQAPPAGGFSHVMYLQRPTSPPERGQTSTSWPTTPNP